MLKADFHVHTHYSRDSNIDPKELVIAAKRLGIGVIAITNHNTMKGCEEVESAAKKHYKKLIVFRGVELLTRKGEIIILNPKEELPKKLALSEACRLAKEQGGFVIIPHVFDMFRKGAGKSVNDVLGYVDAVEGFNSRTLLRSFNEKNISLAKKMGLPMVAGSDAHFIEEFGKAYTIIDSKPDKNEVLDAIKNGRTRIIGEKTGLRPHIKTFLRRRKFI
jgi:predicted metal-dependent phosphoesterase TrpH